MGSKGSQTTTTNQNQTYSANPAIQGAAGQAISGAQSAASQPFQMPVAPVAGFNPQQQQAFNQYSNIQGMAQPYFDQASQYTAQSAAPITGADVNQYYNPMADNVTAQLQNIYGQQNSQNQGMSTQRAGGVGADRIAVGMGNLANQQGLASGQIYSQLYQQALQAAQQQKSMAAGAGSAFAGYGTGAQTAALQGTGALGQSGQIQQQQQQAEMNAPYQNELARIAYQFQTPQYLAGITGGLAPALGGTTTGQQQTTQPSPSWISQLLGLGTAGVGLAGSAGAFGGGSGGVGSYGQGSNASGLGAGTGGMSFPMFEKGGKTPIVNQHGYIDNHINHNHYYYADGGETEDQGPAIPGVHVPKAGGVTPIPTVSLPMGGGHSGPLTGGLNFPSPQQSHDASGGGLSDILKLATTVAPFLKRGGTVPHYGMGGDIDLGQWASDIWNNGPAKKEPDIDFGGRFKGAPYAPNPPDAEFSNPSPVPPGTTPLPTPYSGPGAPSQTPAGTFRIDPSAKPDLKRVPVTGGEEEEATPAKAAPTAYNPPGRAATNPYVMPQAQQPYPDSLKRDWGQNMARSPWLALVKAGATMAASPGPIGSVIGKGILAGTAGLEGQRKELRTEQELNDKAQALYQNAQVHLDKYTKMTPYEQASVTARNREIDQAEPDTGVGKPKEIDVQRIIKSMNESLDPKYMALPLDEKRRLAIQMLRPGSGAAAAPPAAAGPAVGSTKEFDDGKGGKVTGYWDGTKYGPKP